MTYEITSDIISEKINSFGETGYYVQPIAYFIINGLKIKVCDCRMALANEGMLTFSEDKALKSRPSAKQIIKILSSKVDSIIDLLKITF